MALFNRQKAEKGKCKGQESTIGKIIYSFLLFMPILSILVTSMYVIFNKNAYQSYSDDYLYKTYLIDSETQWNTDITYQFKGSDTFTQGGNTGNGDLFYISLTASDLNITQADYDSITKFQITGATAPTRPNLVLKDDNLVIKKRLPITSELIFSARCISLGNTMFRAFEITENIMKSNTLDNVFEYSIKKVEENNLYNWSKNTGTYTVVANTTNLLGINTTFVPMLLTYWFLVSISYFIYDIGLMLVWIIHRKIHELQESI